MLEFGRLLVIIGLVITFTGVIILVAGKLFPWLGNLPGDIHIQGENYNIYIPVATMLLVSILGSILLYIVLRIFRK